MKSIDLTAVPVWPLVLTEISCTLEFSQFGQLIESAGNYSGDFNLDRAIHAASVKFALPTRLPDSPTGRHLSIIRHRFSQNYTMRPATVEISHNLWKLANRKLNIAHLIKMSSQLGGGCHIRAKASVLRAHPEAPMVSYCTPDQIKPRLSAFLHNFNANPQQLPPLAFATATMMDLLLIHPFDDGNGRLSRLMFQLALARTTGLAYPWFDLFHAMQNNRAAFLAAYYSWELDYNPEPLLTIVAMSVQNIIDELTEQGIVTLQSPAISLG